MDMRHGHEQGANMRQRLTTMYSEDHDRLDMENAGVARDRPLAEVQRRGFTALLTNGAAMQWLHRGLLYNHNFFKGDHMKKILSSMAVIGYTILNVAAANAFDGQITFNGTLTDTTCKVNINGGGQLGIVTLPTISTSDLSTEGDTAGETTFNIVLTECSGDTSSEVLAYFEYDAAFVNPTTGNLRNLLEGVSGGATKVELQLLDSADTVIKVGDESQRGGVWATIDASGNATIQHAVRYYATGPGSAKATAGQVKGQVTFTLTYQ